MEGGFATIPLELDIISNSKGASLVMQVTKHPPANPGEMRHETWVRSQGGEDP